MDSEEQVGDEEDSVYSKVSTKLKDHVVRHRNKYIPIATLLIAKCYIRQKEKEMERHIAAASQGFDPSTIGLISSLNRLDTAFDDLSDALVKNSL